MVTVDKILNDVETILSIDSSKGSKHSNQKFSLRSHAKFCIRRKTNTIQLLFFCISLKRKKKKKEKKNQTFELTTKLSCYFVRQQIYSPEYEHSSRKSRAYALSFRINCEFTTNWRGRNIRTHAHKFLKVYPPQTHRRQQLKSLSRSEGTVLNATNL